jgi:CheY-like chemotaxis protein
VAAHAKEHRHTVLFLEDDYDTRDVFIALADSVGVDAVVCANGRDGLDALRDGLRPCVIVLDLAMPDMDGFAFRREQLADPAICDIPVLIVSGGGWANEVDARKLGVTEFFRKPIDLDELIQAFTDCCEVTST